MSAVISEITINQFSDGKIFTNLLSENQFLRTTVHCIITKNWFYSFGEQTSLRLFNNMNDLLIFDVSRRISDIHTFNIVNFTIVDYL